MAKYLKLFTSTSDYNTYIGGSPALPNVSLCTDTNGVHFTALVPVTGITLDKQTPSIQKGSTTTLTATVAPNDASDKSVTWTSSDTTKVTISGSGATVTLNGVAVGSSTITCTSVSNPSITATSTVTVTKIPVTSVSVNPSSTTINKDATVQLTANVLPDNATDKSLEWYSTNSSVATVNGSGVVTGVSGGTATIVAESNDNPSKTGTCTVTVNVPSTVTVKVANYNGNAAHKYAVNYTYTSNSNLTFDKSFNVGNTVRIKGKVVNGNYFNGQSSSNIKENFDISGTINNPELPEDTIAPIGNSGKVYVEWDTTSTPSKTKLNVWHQDGSSYYIHYSSLEVWLNGTKYELSYSY